MRYRRIPAGSARAVEICITDRHDGDFRVDGPAEELAESRRAVFSGEWTWLRQVHGAEVVDVTTPGGGAGTEADGSVTELADAVLCIQTADCVPVVLVGDGVLGVAHAGWRGLVDGVVERTVEAVRSKRDGPIRAMIGPCIRPDHYAFGLADIERVEAAVGGVVRAATLDGTPALDMAGGVRMVLERAGVTDIDDLGLDTADERWFSHRVRRDTGRQVTAARLVTS